MTFHKEGYTTLALCILFIFIVNAALQVYYPHANTIKWFIYILSFLSFAAVIVFFRNPGVDIDANDNAVLSPADGTIVAIKEVEETELLKDKRIQVSVQLSTLNARVNRNPIAGVVKYCSYQPKSSAGSEHTTIGIKNNAGVSVLIRQVAGALPGLLANYVHEGDAVEQGKPFGFLKFGSRVDIFLPLGTKIEVELNEVVKGGSTVLAELKS